MLLETETSLASVVLLGKTRCMLVGKTSGVHRYGPEFDSHVFASGWHYANGVVNRADLAPIPSLSTPRVTKEEICKKWT